MKILLASIGTGGDVFPFLGLGRALIQNGHQVAIASNENFRSIAEAEGMEFGCLMSREATDAFLSDPDLWHPLKCAIVGARLGRDLLPEQYATIKAMAMDNDPVDLMVTSTAILPARFLQEQFSIPLISIILQPWMIPSNSAPPKMPGGWSLPKNTPNWLGNLYWRGVDAAGDFLVGRYLNRFRKTIDLPPIKRVFQYWLSPDLALGFFPDWYGIPQDDWPSQIQTTNFPVFDGNTDLQLSSELESFLDSGPPPIVFTFGTGMMQAKAIFHKAVEACEKLNERALLITKYKDQIPANLPSNILHVDYAPFQSLLPRCQTLVHHGGIGTVGRAIHAGIPQLILPFAFDQMDNAHRVRQLGLGDGLRSKCSVGALAKKLAELKAKSLPEDIRMKVSASRPAEDSYRDIVEKIESSRQM